MEIKSDHLTFSQMYLPTSVLAHTWRGTFLAYADMMYVLVPGRWTQWEMPLFTA